MASVDVIKTISPSGEEDDVLSINNTDAEEVSYTFGNILNFSGEYTFSCWMKSTSTNFDISVHISNVNHSFTITNEWQRIIYTGQANVAESKEVLFTIPSGFNLYAYQGQLEKGTIATDFAVNPQDLLSSIYDVDNKIVTLQTNFEVQQGQIDALIRDTTIDGTKLKDKFTQMQATVDGLNVTVGDVQSDIGTINSQMASLNLTVDGLTTEVSKAGNDAEEAKTLAQQTSNKFSWLVKSGTNETNFELTDRTAQLVADNINLKGLVKFEGLDSSAQDMITNGYKIGTGNPYQGEAYNYGIGIRKVKGKTVQQTTNGYQLFDTSKITNRNGITVTHEADGSFTLNGKAVNDYDSYIINTYGSTDIAITSGLKLKANVTNVNIRVIVGNGKKTFRDLPLSTDIQDFNASNISWVVLRINNNTSVDNLNLKIMLYQDGDGTWEQYTGGKPAPNPDYAMDIKNVEISEIYSTNDYNTDNNMELIGKYLNSQGTESSSDSWDISKYISIPLGITKFTAVGISGGAPSICFYDASKNFISGEAYNNRVDFDISIPTNAKFFRFSSLTKERKNEHLFIGVYGYETVETSLTLAEGDIYENGQVTRVRKQITFDGSSDEAWSRSQTDEKAYRFNILLSDSLGDLWLSKTGQACNRLPVGNTWSELKDNCFSIDNSKYLTVYIDELKNSTLEEFKTWLSTYPLTIEYELATPTTEELEIPTVPSYYPYTEVYIDSDVEPTDVEWNINTASNSALTTINNWTNDAIINGTTTINGGYIKTQTITTDQLAVEDIFSTGSAVMNIINAQEINADRITSGTIKANFLELYGLSVLQKDTDRVTLGIDTEGNITMRGTVESYNYVAGKTGWSIKNDGDAEFNDVTVRGSVITGDGGIVSSGGTGINLLKNSSLLYSSLPQNTNFSFYTVNNISSSQLTNDGLNYTATSDNGAQNSSRGIRVNLKEFDINVGDTITFSCDVKGKFGTNNNGLTIMHATTANSAFYALVSAGTKYPTTISNWERKSRTYTIPSNIRVESTGECYIYFFFGGGYGSEVNVYVRNIKLEKGSVATAWSPTPEDNLKQVRFWAGSTYEQRENAPFRVYSDGSVEATEGTYSGVWTGDIRVGNISIVDPSSISGGDAAFTIQDGQNGTKVVELTDADYSSFRQTLHIDNAYGDTMVSLSQGGSIVANTSITVGTTHKTIIDDDSITINGGTFTSNGTTLTIGASNIDIGNTNSTTPIDMNGNTTVNGVLKAMKEINYNDVLVCKTSTNGLDFSFLE